ncbi:MAG: hypothetical protein FWC13_05340 [Oscillospiraceae bacterium]|nr:hypothetical protein [Oscillospiraceae bacterium]
MSKVIKSQDKTKLHYMPEDVPCFFNVAPVEAADEESDAGYSVGINGVSFGVYKKLPRAKAVLGEIETAMLEKKPSFSFPKN